jgi:hypothetical protein
MDKIDITMPTTLRPGILKRTLDSFCSNLFTDEKCYRFIFNVDPIGEKRVTSDSIVELVKSYFSNILYNLPKSPHFPKAFKWCWDQVEADFVFHMNEDWELIRKIDINDMIRLHLENPRLANLRLLKLAVPEANPENQIKLLSGKYKYENDMLIAINNHNQYSTNPQFIKGTFVKLVRPYINNKLNPETQLKMRLGSKELHNIMKEWDIGIYSKPGDSKCIQEIGKDWKFKHGFEKNGEAEFTTWKRIK